MCRLTLLTCLLIPVALGCSSAETNQEGSGGSTPDPPDPGCTAYTDCASTPDTPLCEEATGSCVALPPGHQVGWKDGSPGSVALSVVYEADKVRDPQDLQFNPSVPSELWIVNRTDDSVIVIQKPGQPDGSAKRYHDPAASHFMDSPPALSFGAVSSEWGQTFATCGDSDGGDNFMGPALFSADLSIFAKSTPGGLGSHLDMLHSTTFCRGIEHVDANVYFVFNSTKSSLDKYDFGQDHGPGNDDHSDGRIHRYAKGAFSGVDGVPSHLALDAATGQLYVADTGNHRILRLDIESGTLGSNFSGFEDVIERRNIDDAIVADVVPPGLLNEPSGIELHDNLLFVTDHATSLFYVFDLEGQLVRTLDTGLPPGSLAGLAFGPDDDKIYFADRLTGRVYRIDPLF